jgi:Zn-dependent protease
MSVPASSLQSHAPMTSWSWKLGRVAGVDIYMHATFVLLLAWMAIAHYFERHRMIDAVNGVVFIIALFAIVVLHELGHAVAARHFDIGTRDITLLPIGGVARLERFPDDPKQELLVALAGPAVNVALALLLALAVAPAEALDVWDKGAWLDAPFLAKLSVVNATVAVFNLIPAFPMDGGRALRALLALRLDYLRATQLAAQIGQAFALTFGMIGLFAGNPVLVFIAMFVWMGAASENGLAQMRGALAGIPVSRVMITDFRTLAPDDTLGRALEYVLAGFQQDFPVAQDGHVLGVLTRAKLMKGLTDVGVDGTVAAAMERRTDGIDAGTMLDSWVERVQAGTASFVPVLRGEALVGILTAENVAEFLMGRGAQRTALRANTTSA